MTETTPPIEPGPPIDELDTADPGSARALTDLTMDRHLEERLRELDTTIVQLQRSRDAWKVRAESLSAELDWTRDRVARLGRLVRVSMTLRGVARQPRSIVRLPRDLGRALTVPLDPIRIPAAPIPRPDAADGRQAEVRRLILQRAREDRAPRDPHELVVAIIADQRLIDGLAPECRLIELRPDGWRDQLQAQPPDLLLVESAWHGNGGSWQYRVATHAHPFAIGLSDLAAVTSWCTSRTVPTVFWNTQDPVRTDRFDEAAMLFDWIFTVDPERVQHYDALADRRAAGIDVLGPAVQPRIHHPGLPTTEPRTGALLVDGGDPAWRLDRREARSRLADAATGVDLTVLDPSLGAFPRGDLPAALRSARAAGGPLLDLPAAYRRFSVVLAPSPSSQIIPAAALESLACGTPVVMTSNRPAAAAFGDLVSIQDGPEPLRASIEHLVRDPGAGRAVEIDGLRSAIRAGTYGDRLLAIARAVGLVVAPPATGIAALVEADDGIDLDLDLAAAMIAEQERQPDEVVVGASRWETGRRLQERLERSCQGMPVVLLELSSGLTDDERFLRLAAAATSARLVMIDPAATADPGHIDRLAAWLQTGLPGGPDGLLERSAVLARAGVPAAWGSGR